jgi:hypothetical protein
VVAAAAAVPRPLSSMPRFRFWIDYQAFSSPESAALPEAALLALGGVKTGGPPKLDPVTGAGWCRGGRQGLPSCSMYRWQPLPGRPPSVCV